MKKLNELTRYTTNPFVVELKGRMYLQPKPNIVIAKGEKILDVTTGEILQDNILIGRRKTVDRTTFTKLYFQEISSVMGFSKTAQQIFYYIAKKLDFENKVIVNTELASKEIGYKNYQSVAKGLRELASKNIIAGGIIPGMYWVNPLVLCKGERFSLYTEIVTEQYIMKEEILKEQNARRYDVLDEHTARSLEAMNNRAECAWEKGAEEYEKNFPGMSGESKP